MDDEKMTLGGLSVSDCRKWYCNTVENDDPRCCDTYDELGNNIQRIGRYILSGEEKWYYNFANKCYYFYADNKYFNETDGGFCDPMLCTHFSWTSDGEHTPLYMFSGGDKNQIQFNYDNGVGGIDNFVDWVRDRRASRTPVEIRYVLLFPRYYTCLHDRTAKQVLKRFLGEYQ